MEEEELREAEINVGKQDVKKLEGEEPETDIKPQPGEAGK